MDSQDYYVSIDNIILEGFTVQEKEDFEYELEELLNRFGSYNFEIDYN